MRILLVEDDTQLRTAIERGLREAAYAVTAAADGAEALRLAQSAEYDAIILDILLPSLDGRDVCRRIRATGSRVPILMLTALDAVEHRIAGLDAGADDYLSKPFDFGELLARLRALTRRSGTVTPTTITIGDLIIDTNAQRVERAGREIALTAKEYAFLLHLARNAGRVVSRAELMSHVWDDARSSYTNIIDVYASRLRRKIDDDESEPLFATSRGTGYMLNAAVRRPRTKDASKSRG